MDDVKSPQMPAQVPDAGDTRARRFRSGLVAAGAAAGMTLAGLGVAAGQTDGSTTPPESAAPTAAAPTPAAPGGAHRPDPGPGGRHVGMGQGIHGEVTTRAPEGGGYRTFATQLGEVTAVDRSSLTVKSEDGFSRTYGVDDETMVNGDEGIASVARGDQVRVIALVVDGKATAVSVHDATKDAPRHEGRAPGLPHPAPPSQAPPSHPETVPDHEPGAGTTTTTTG